MSTTPVKSEGRAQLLRSTVVCFGIPMPMYETFRYPMESITSQLDHGVLRQVAFWLRPFCKVRWVLDAKVEPTFERSH